MKMKAIILTVFLLCELIFARIHRLEITNDIRKYIALSTFGYYQGGLLNVQLFNFTSTPENQKAIFGFSIDRTQNDVVNPYLDNHQDRCLLQESLNSKHDSAVAYFIFDLSNNLMNVSCNSKFSNHLYKNMSDIPQPFAPSPNRLRRLTDLSASDSCKNAVFKLIPQELDGRRYYNTSFAMYVSNPTEEGFYNLYFHNCANYNADSSMSFDFIIEIIEQNLSSYLSAHEMPLPALYCTLSILFFLSGLFWVFILKQSKHPVFKIHYMMAVLVFLKSVSLAFHGVNYHYIERLGVHLATWAVLYYIAHLLKGALLFVTLVMIGTGWTFIKHVLAPRDKRVFMTVIPLQVLANVAEIILAESEEGAREYYTWRCVAVLVDLLCCGCILFPVVWSIRHLQEASETDGKAAINLRKLELFKHFYIMIVCYIYFTRMIVALLEITVPFQYGWLSEMFREMGTYVFFVLTAYKFRPASNNPYFALNLDDDDEELVLTENGLTENITNLTYKNKQSTNMTEVTEEESDALLVQKENSHDYD